MRFIAVLCLTVVSLSASGELSNRRAPGFALPNTNYERFYDLQDYRGKVLLIDIMRTNCPHCMVLSTTLEKVKAKYGDKVGILSVVIAPDTPEGVVQYIAKKKVKIPIVYDMGQITISYFNANPSQPHIEVPH